MTNMRDRLDSLIYCRCGGKRLWPLVEDVPFICSRCNKDCDYCKCKPIVSQHEEISR